MNFGNNRLQAIDVSKTFSGLELDTLNLYDNAISSITGKLSEIKFLKLLNLKNNALKKLSYETFSNLSSLRSLDLSNNKIEIIEAGTFDSSVNLRTIKLSRNYIRYLPKGLFRKALSLKSVFMDGNHIESVDEDLFANCENLDKIEMQQNRLSNVTRLLISSRKFRYFKVRDNKLHLMPIFSRPDDGKACSSITSLKDIDAGHNEIVYFSASCYKHVVYLYLSYNLINDISNFDELHYVEHLFLRNNKIKTLPRTAMNSLCTKLVWLDIGSNLIERIDEGTFSHCQYLTLLKLDENSLKVFEPLYLKSFKDIHLSRNPLRCDCENKQLINWLNTSSTVKVDHTRCENGQALSTFRLENCTNLVFISDLKDVVMKIGIPIAAIVFVTCIIAILFFKFRYEIQVIAFYRWNIRLACCCTNKTDENVQWKYDAFICFAEEDIVFVQNRLIPMLEPKYNICIYYRDFPVGEDIAESILETIDNSAVIIILLSENFMNSRWGTFEFRSAHYSAMRKKNKRLLIVILNESFLQTKMDLTLRSILYTKSYLKADDSLFKEKLIHSMPSIPVKSVNQNDNEKTRGSRNNVYETESTMELSSIYDTIQL
ncbi:toll-like receptor Tollo [Ruditapes philippinarum]|uniref:toll-like receptor Tollo n=1 Tax=Ruditapes philippinarum TaxID=129788 RepID=UPI00295A6419|nr:toll-like receptor Tollo [Ruditapes philippinarum]